MSAKSSSRVNFQHGRTSHKKTASSSRGSILRNIPAPEGSIARYVRTTSRSLNQIQRKRAGNAVSSLRILRNARRSPKRSSG